MPDCMIVIIRSVPEGNRQVTIHDLRVFNLSQFIIPDHPGPNVEHLPGAARFFLTPLSRQNIPIEARPFNRNGCENRSRN